jgi:alpha-tubulin suppressor-like RCC1 family protein
LPLSTNPLLADTDDDGLSDGIEVGGVTEPLKQDTDNDGLKDGEEVITYGTNPVLADTDGDGARDDVEVAAGTNPKLNSSLPKPVITSQPVSITNTAGGSATFSVTATNPAGVPSGLTYQWKKSTNIISGQTNQTLNLAPLTVLQSGSYSVVVANIYGSTNSTVATLTVTKANPTITVAPTATPIVYGQTLDSSILSGGVASVEGLFTFTTPSTAPNAGTASQGVTFRPSDTANYNTATALVNVTVNQALISSGFSHTLYLGAGATTVTAWGVNSDGRLGVGDTNSPVNWARAVQGIPTNVTVFSLAAGGTHSLILANGKVYAAGSDRFGQLGQGGTSRINQSSFIQVFGSPSDPVVAVSAGGNHSLALTEFGDVYACGDNTYGQLGNSTLVSSATWIKVSIQYPSTGLSPKIVSVVAGADHNLAVDEDGGVWVWGRNNYGQLGIGKRSLAERTPSKLNLEGEIFAESVAAGFSHSLILTINGEVLGFGRNNSGQTGQSATSSVVLVPAQISGLSGIRLISAGTDSSFAIDGEGQLRSWGYNAYGELLLGYASPAVYEPVPSQICDNVSVVSGGGYSSLAWGVQGLVFGGRNDVGQAGNGPDPALVVGDYYYTVGNLTLTNLTMDLAGTTETLYDQIFVGKGMSSTLSGTTTLNGILNLMFVGTYTGPVYGTTQTFDLIWAKNGIVFGAGYELAFNQAGYLVESAVADKIVEGVSGKVLQATVRAVVTAADLEKAADLAEPNLDGVEEVPFGVASSPGISALSVSPSREVVRMEMIYSYERPSGGVMSGAEYFVDEGTYLNIYRVKYSSSSPSGPWVNASVTGTTVTPLGKDSLGKDKERVTLRISSSGSAGFLRLEVAEEENNPQATPSN